MIDELTICAQDLVVAVFRLAVADYRGLYYGFDGPVPRRSCSSAYRDKAAGFLGGSWARHLGDVAGFSAARVWREAN